MFPVFYVVIMIILLMARTKLPTRVDDDTQVQSKRCHHGRKRGGVGVCKAVGAYSFSFSDGA